MTNFPSQPRMLTTGWLTQMLRLAGQLTDEQEIHAFAIQSIGDGVSMLGQVVRVELVYKDDSLGGPSSLVIKFASEDEGRRAVGMELRGYEWEVTFYTQIAGSVEVPKPACYFAAVGKESGNYIVVLEDMRRYRAGDQLVGVGRHETKRVIDALLPLHVAFWGKTDQAFLRDVMHVDTTWMEQYMKSVEGSWRNCITQFGYCIPAEVARSVADYVGGLRRLHKLMGDRTQTLVHGDPRLDNIMFNEGIQGPPVVLLDWQTLMINNPLHDLALILSMSATIEIRRSIEDEMVHYYHSKLVELGVTGYKLEQCYEDYDLAVLYLMSVGLVMGGFQPANERGRRLAEEVLRRSCAAVVDRGLLVRIPAKS